jgi:hypothetical protein
MSVLEVGSGPAPAIYAARDYYTDLADWCNITEQPLSALPITQISTLDRGPAWNSALHAISEALLMAGPAEAILPFALTYHDLEGFSIRVEHRREIEREIHAAQSEFDYYDEPVDPGRTREEVLKAHNYPPSAYDIIVMCNFLTNAEIADSFSDEIGDLARSLTPGGIMLILGSASDSSKYSHVYEILDSIIQQARPARVAKVLNVKLQAHTDAPTRVIIASQIVASLEHIQSLSRPKFNTVHAELPLDVRQLKPDLVSFARFRILAYKNMTPPRGAYARRRQAN